MMGPDTKMYQPWSSFRRVKLVYRHRLSKLPKRQRKRARKILLTAFRDRKAIRQGKAIEP